MKWLEFPVWLLSGALCGLSTALVDTLSTLILQQINPMEGYDVQKAGEASIVGGLIIWGGAALVVGGVAGVFDVDMVAKMNQRHLQGITFGLIAQFCSGPLGGLIIPSTMSFSDSLAMSGLVVMFILVVYLVLSVIREACACIRYDRQVDEQVV